MQGSKGAGQPKLAQLFGSALSARREIETQLLGR